MRYNDDIPVHTATIVHALIFIVYRALGMLGLVLTETS